MKFLGIQKKRLNSNFHQQRKFEYTNLIDICQVEVRNKFNFNVYLAQLKSACLLHNWTKGPFSLSTSVHNELIILFQALKCLHNSHEFLPFVIFLKPPPLEPDPDAIIGKAIFQFNVSLCPCTSTIAWIGALK